MNALRRRPDFRSVCSGRAHIHMQMYFSSTPLGAASSRLLGDRAGGRHLGVRCAPAGAAGQPVASVSKQPQCLAFSRWGERLSRRLIYGYLEHELQLLLHAPQWRVLSSQQSKAKRSATAVWQLQPEVAQIRVHNNLTNQRLNLILTPILTVTLNSTK